MSNMLLLTEALVPPAWALVPPARGYLDLSAGNPRPMDSPAVGVSSRKGGDCQGERRVMAPRPLPSERGRAMT